MTGNTILSTFETFIDETLDESVEISLANQARGELETELKLQASIKLDMSQTAAVGGTYQTAYPLAGDILMPKSTIIYVGEAQYTGVPFDHQQMYKNIPYHWFVDLFNGNFYLTGTIAKTETITFPYITSGTDIAADDNTVLKWPSFTHILIPMQMAKIWFAIDQGDKGRAWDDRWSDYFEQTKQALISWDQKWKLASIGDSTPYGTVAPMQLENRVNIDR